MSAVTHNIKEKFIPSRSNIERSVSEPRLISCLQSLSFQCSGKAHPDKKIIWRELKERELIEEALKIARFKTKMVHLAKIFRANSFFNYRITLENLFSCTSIKRIHELFQYIRDFYLDLPVNVLHLIYSIGRQVERKNLLTPKEEMDTVLRNIFEIIDKSFGLKASKNFLLKGLIRSPEVMGFEDLNFLIDFCLPESFKEEGQAVVQKINRHLLESFGEDVPNKEVNSKNSEMTKV